MLVPLIKFWGAMSQPHFPSKPCGFYCGILHNTETCRNAWVLLAELTLAIIPMWLKRKVKLFLTVFLTKSILTTIILSGKARIQSPDCLTPTSVFKTLEALKKKEHYLLSALISDCIRNNQSRLPRPQLSLRLCPSSQEPLQMCPCP